MVRATGLHPVGHRFEPCTAHQSSHCEDWWTHFVNQQIRNTGRTVLYASMPHFFYLARCADSSLYAGTCIDPEERAAIHNAGKGAKYTRSRLPISFIHLEQFRTLSAARKREAEVKKWKREEKELLIRSARLKKSRRTKKAEK